MDGLTQRHMLDARDGFKALALIPYFACTILIAIKEGGLDFSESHFLDIQLEMGTEVFISEDQYTVLSKSTSSNLKKLKVACQERRLPKQQGPLQNKEKH